jgi:hypothetical protein
VDQILRCLANFTSEKLLRENHGKGLADATKRMMEKDNGFALQAVISALIDMGNYASTDEVNAIPTDLRDFIDRWKNYSICKAAGLSLTGILHSTDQVDMNSLVEFVRNAELPNYLAIWLEFSKVEFDTSEELRDDCKGRPDLFLSNIEELATLKRYNMNKDPNSPLFQFFYKFTCMRKFILETAPKDFYHSNSYRVEAQDPFVSESVMAGNKIPLMILLRTSFEMSIYENYNKHLIAQAYLASVQGDSETSGNTDDFFTENELDGEDKFLDLDLDIQNDSEDEDDISNMKKRIEENSYVDTSILKILYYILGAAIRSALGILRTLLKKLGYDDLLEEILQCITNALSITLDDSKHQNLPYHLIESRQTKIGALILPSCGIFKIIIDLEENLLKPLLGTTRAIASLGSDLITYVKLRVEAEGFFFAVDKLLFHVLNKLQIIYLDESTITNIVETVRMKFFDYYLKAATKDMLKLVMKTLNINKAESRLSFRAHTLLQSIKKGDLEIDIK